MKYLLSLFAALVLLSGCAADKCCTSKALGRGYTDYQATAKDGSVKIHRVYSNGSEEWINPAK